MAVLYRALKTQVLVRNIWNARTSTLHYIQIYNAPYMSIRKRIWSAAMAPERTVAHLNYK